jgi:hypothetical protein
MKSRVISRKKKSVTNASKSNVTDAKSLSGLLFANGGFLEVFKLSDKEKQILRSVYVDMKPMKKIEKESGFSGDRINRVCRKAFRVIRVGSKNAVENYRNLLKLQEDYHNLQHRYRFLEQKLRKSGKNPIAMQYDPATMQVRFADLMKDYRISRRLSNCLIGSGIKTLGDVLQYSPEEMLKLKNFGVTTLRELQDVLDEHGLKLGNVNGRKTPIRNKYLNHPREILKVK